MLKRKLIVEDTSSVTKAFAAREAKKYRDDETQEAEENSFHPSTSYDEYSENQSQNGGGSDLEIDLEALGLFTSIDSRDADLAVTGEVSDTPAPMEIEESNS